MLSLIEVTCPHCAAQGQIMLPPPWAIVVGPCPECHGMVAVFCGRVLPLDNEIMDSEDVESKREHLGEILGNFLHKRIDQLFGGGNDDEEIRYDPIAPDKATAEDVPPARTGLEEIDPSKNTPAPTISKEEVESFKNVDLRLLDNPDYFRAIFDES